MFGLSVDFFSMGTIKQVVNNVGTHALDCIIVHSYASSEHSKENLPYIRCSAVIPSSPGDLYFLLRLDISMATWS